MDRKRLFRLSFLTLKLFFQVALILLTPLVALFTQLLSAYLKVDSEARERDKPNMFGDAQHGDGDGWRSGHSGYGNYQDGMRVDPHDFDDPDNE